MVICVDCAARWNVSPIVKAKSSNPRLKMLFIGVEIGSQNVEKCKNTLFWNIMVFVLTKKMCFLVRLIGREIRCCYGFLASQQLFGRACENDLATHGAAAGTKFDEVVALLQHFQIVLDKEDGVACFDHGVEEVEDSLDVVEVEAVGRLVHNEDFACVAKIGSQFDALQLTAREGRE